MPPKPWLSFFSVFIIWQVARFPTVYELAVPRVVGGNFDNSKIKYVVGETVIAKTNTKYVSSLLISR